MRKLMLVALALLGSCGDGNGYEAKTTYRVRVITPGLATAEYQVLGANIEKGPKAWVLTKPSYKSRELESVTISLTNSEIVVLR